MYPMQCYPNYAQCSVPYSQPQVNGVKIDINNPQAYGGTNSQGQANPIHPTQQPYAPIYNYPYAPIYGDMAAPQIPMAYNYPVPCATPFVMPQPPQLPQTQTNNVAPVVTPKTVPTAPTVVPSAPVQAAVQTATTTATPAAPVPNTASTPAVVPAPQATVAVQQPVVVPVPAVPVVPAPTVVQPQVVTVPTPAPQPVTQTQTQTVNVNPAIPAAVVDKKENTTVAPVAPVTKAPETSVTKNDNTIKELTDGLTSKNPDDQTVAIQKMAEIAQTDPETAKGLLNEQTFGHLVNIINADTSQLKGPDGKTDAANLSPLEKAEINKQFAVYTLAILQKNFRDEINKEMKKNNLPDIAINDLPYIKEGIVNNLKDNTNPTIREACLSALNYVGRPEDKDVLKVLYEITAKHDSNPAVKSLANDYLSKLPA